MKALAPIALLVSLALYLAQIFLYTKDQEIVVYGVYGAFWFLVMYLNAFSAPVRSATAGIVLLSGLAAFGLGFVPHRLRLGPGFDIYVALFPAVHFLATFTYLSARRRTAKNRCNPPLNLDSGN